LHFRYDSHISIRHATPEDAAACAAIYAPYVTDTAISFETEAPSVAEMAVLIASSIAWFGVEDDDLVAGYAYAGRFHPRAAYRWACEVSVYLERGRRRTGAGRALYAVLPPHLAQRGYRTAIAGMTLPNPASEGLHAALGFEPVGTYRSIGYKFGAWHDVAWTQHVLAGGDGHPTEPH
jgi:phosphinothricin acetyltransferase